MSGKKLKRISEFVKVSTFAKEIILKRECNRFRIRLKDEPDICECGYTRALHSPEALQNEFNQTEPSMKTSPTDAFGKLLCVEYEEEDPDQNSIRYVRLDWETDVNSVLELIFCRWKIKQPSVILSVVSDSDRFTDKTTSKLIEWICSHLVEAAASTSAWIITGGLNKGVDKIIGDEVNQKRGKQDKNVQAVLGICHWGCLQDTNLLKASSGSYDYASNSNPTGLSLDQHHTHFLLVDDGKQKKSDCEWKLRLSLELSLAKQKTSDKKSSQLIYILIGGGINSLTVVKHALENEIPVLVVTGTGGAADAISSELKPFPGVNLENFPEISEELFHRLEELLEDKISSADKKFLSNEIAKLLEKATFSKDDVHRSKEDVTKSKRKSNNRVSDGIRGFHVPKQTSSDGDNTSAANVEFDTVKRMHYTVTQMLEAKGIPSHNAKQAADDLEHNVLNETFKNFKSVFELLKAIQGSEKQDMLIKIKMTGSQGENIINFIADVLNNIGEVKSRRHEVLTTESSSQHTEALRKCDIYMMVAVWNDEAFFRKLLLENWMSDCHQEVLRQLLKKMKKSKRCMNKYAELIVIHHKNSTWLTGPDGYLVQDFKQNKMCKLLMRETNPGGKDKHTSKLQFVWCVEKDMPETAMLFWERGQDCLAMVLIAYHVSKKKMKSLVEKEGYEEMKKQMEFFSEHAINLLNACYADNHQNTHDLLVSRVECLKEDGPLTPLQIAEKANFGTLISTVPIQDLLNKIWTKGIKDYKKSNYIPMILSEACPLLAPLLFNIRPDNIDDENQEESDQGCKCVCEYFRKVRSFIDTPCVKFTYGLISYLFYLLLFSVVMLTGFRKKMSRLEMLLSGWTFVLLIEEIKQAVVQKSDYLNIYNFFDIGAIITYIVGFSLRVIYQYDPTICPVCLYLARIVLAFSLLVFFIRTLPFLSIFNDIGPKIYMMGRLITDLMGFMLIMVIFVSAYGVVTNIIMYPNQPLGLKLLHDIYYDASWSVLGQFNREEISGSLCNRDNDSELFNARRHCKNATNDNINYVQCKADRCPANNWIVGFLLTLYALFMIIMLLNILIAMFNATFSSVKEREKAVSKMQQYQLIRDYSSQSMVPVPLCVITYPYVFVKYLFNLNRGHTESQNQTSTGDQDTEAQSTSKDQKQNENKSIPSKNKSKDNTFERGSKGNVSRWERAMVAKYYKETKDKNGRNETSK